MGAAKTKSRKTEGTARGVRRGAKVAAIAGRLVGRGGRASYRTGRRVGRAKGTIRGARMHRRVERGAGRVAAIAVAAGAIVGFVLGRAMGRRGQPPEEGTHPGAAPGTSLNDANLANKVRSEIFRPDDAPKGEVVVNVENGSVYLRGEIADPGVAEDLVARARSVEGVSRVVNLLHAPGEPAPSKDDRSGEAA